MLYYGEDYRKLEQELETAKAAIKKVCRDFDKVNDELARLKRENEELKKIRRHILIMSLAIKQ